MQGDNKMKNDINELTNEVLNDKELLSKIEKAENAQEVSELLAEKGIVISAETIDEFMDQQIDSRELDEVELANVSGGGFKLRYVNPLYWVGRLIAYGTTRNMC